MIQTKFWISGAQINEGNKTLHAQTWLVAIKLLPHTVLLNLEIACKLGDSELISIKNYSKTIGYYFLILAD